MVGEGEGWAPACHLHCHFQCTVICTDFQCTEHTFSIALPLDLAALQCTVIFILWWVYVGLHLHGGNTMSSALSDGTSFPDLHDLLSTLLPQMITSHWLTHSSENEYFAKKNQTPKIGRHSSFWRIWPKIPQMVADSSVDENFILQRKLPGTLVHVGPQKYPGHLDVWSEVKGLVVNVWCSPNFIAFFSGVKISLLLVSNAIPYNQITPKKIIFLWQSIPMSQDVIVR